MTITLRPITKDNWRAVELLSLSLSAEQQQFVAFNSFSILESIFEPEIYTSYAIYQDETPVGYLMTAYKNGQHWVLRLMIGSDYQGKGYGTQGLSLILEQFRADPECREVYISFEQTNTVARDLYAKLGFMDTGEIRHGEHIYRLPLEESHPS